MLPLHPAQPSPNADAYFMPQWSDGYVQVNAHGEVCMHPSPTGKGVALAKVAHLAKERGLRLPLLVRFPQIVQHRIEQLDGAFKRAFAQLQYDADYFPVYPIKVNQQKAVVDAVVAGQASAGLPVCLEAGSKPELIAVLAQANNEPALIVCNGYKDEHYIRLALMAEKLGHRVFLVIEKPSELPLILSCAQQLDVQPRLGVRARLATVGKGNWQNTGGEKSKFGLSATQVLALVEQLKAHDALSYLQLLHFHLGSQLADLDDIERGLQESRSLYASLLALNAPIGWVDVGGGLGIDYDGTCSQSPCSMNYGLDEYARSVVAAFKAPSADSPQGAPNIITESGRAMSAHHAVLLTDIIDSDVSHGQTSASPPQASAHAASHRLWQLYTNLNEQVFDASLDHLEHARADLEHIQTSFSQGLSTLQERATGEQLFASIAQRVLRCVQANENNQDALEALRCQQADKVFVNFSLFQSAPDIWGIDQIFPIVPLASYHQPAAHHTLLQDITCDSDGRIDTYVGREPTTLPLPSIDKGTLLGMFLLGAYQEILGDMHNLFGDTDSLDVWVNDDGVQLSDEQQGDTIADVLDYVHYQPHALKAALLQQVANSNLSTQHKAIFEDELSQSLQAYTYLESALV